MQKIDKKLIEYFNNNENPDNLIKLQKTLKSRKALQYIASFLTVLLIVIVSLEFIPMAHQNLKLLLLLVFIVILCTSFIRISYLNIFCILLEIKLNEQNKQL